MQENMPDLDFLFARLGAELVLQGYLAQKQRTIL
jgi:hypothetical protein